METTVTISLAEYNGYQKLKEGLKKRTVIEAKTWCGYTSYYIPEDTCTDILLNKIKQLEDNIKRLEEQNKKHLDAQYDCLRAKINQEYKPKKWWKL